MASDATGRRMVGYHGHARWAAALAALVVGTLWTAPVAAAPPSPPLDETRDRLEVASRELTEIEAEVRRAGDAVAAVDERLRVATTELHVVADELTAAEEAATATGVAEREAAAALADAVDELASLSAAHRDGQAQLTAQVVATYKRGSAPTTDLAFSGVVRAGDWHEVAVTRGVLERMLTDQHEAVTANAELTRDTARANAEVGDARRHAVAATRIAEADRERVSALVVRQERLVATVDEERAQRAEVLARLEQDAAARAVLVTDLERRVAQLEQAAAAVLVPVVAVPDDGPPPAWAVRLPAAGQAWAASIDAAARRNGIDGRLLAALVWTESNFRPDAVSHAGAIGLAQLMPGTAGGLGVDPFDPAANLAGGATYLRTQLTAFDRVDLALAAYNAGPGRVSRAGGVPAIVETQLYVVKVLERYEHLRGDG